MDSESRLRAAILSGGNEWSGMTASAVVEEEIDIVAVISVQATPRRKSPSTRKRKTSKFSRFRKHVALARALPSLYKDKLYGRICPLFGRRPTSLYHRLRRREEKALSLAARYIGEEFRNSIYRNRAFPTLLEVADLYDIPVHVVDDINSEECASLLRSLDLDFVLGLGTSIIKPNILGIPRIGFLNGHSSLLPDYRGGSTEFWQLFHGEARTGVTIHWMAENVDAGDIVVQGSWEIPEKANHLQLRLASAFERTRLWKEAIRSIVRDQHARPQGESKTKVFRHPSLTQLHRYYVLGERQKG